LQEGVVRLWTEADCKAHRMRDPRPGEQWPGNEFCALGVGDHDAEDRTPAVTDSCNADSGGPLVQLDRNNCPVMNAIVSQGPVVCGQKAPGIYTRISAHYPWIKSVTGSAKLMAVTAPTEIPPAGAIYALALAQARVPSQGGLKLAIAPQGPSRPGDVIKLSFKTGARAGKVFAYGFGPRRRLTRYSQMSINFSDPVVYKVLEADPPALAAGGVAAMPADPEKGFVVTGPPGTHRILAFSYPTIALNEALKLEMRTRARNALADQAYVGKIMPFLAPYTGLQIVQAEIGVVQ
jgi:hypothetical protein